MNYIAKYYNQNSVLIAYGSDHVKRILSEDRQMQILKQYGVVKKDYSVSICRIEPENNCEMILEAFAHTGNKLLYVGNWERCEFGKLLKKKYSKYDNISIVDAIYDLDVLYGLRNNCKFYIHGHSAGGTNPSLVEAMFCKCNILAYDVVYNRETTGNKAHYFSDAIDLALSLSGKEELSDNSSDMYELAMKRYTWRKIAQQYESLY